MRMKKRRGGAAAFIAVVTVLSLAACGGSDSAEAPATAEPTAGQATSSAELTGTVRVLMEGVPDTDVVTALLPEFNKLYPGVTVEIETAAYDQMRDKYVASFQAPESTYDLAIIDNPWMYDFAEAGFLAPLDEKIASTPDYNYEDIAEPLRAINEVNAVTYGVPFYNYVLGLIYRTDLLADAGLPVPTTLDELVATAQKLTTPERSGIAMQPQRGYKIFEEWGNWLFSAGGSIYDENGVPTLDTPAARTALEAYISAYNSAAPADSLNWGFDEALRSVSSNQSAMMISYNWMLPALNKANDISGDLAGKFALAPMPGGKQVLGSWNWAIPANASNPDASWAFISWITSPEIEKARVIAGGAPVRISPLSDPAVAQAGFGADYYAAVALMLANSDPLSQGPNGEEMIQAVGTELNSAVAGTKSVADALAEAQKQAVNIQGL